MSSRPPLSGSTSTATADSTVSNLDRFAPDAPAGRVVEGRRAVKPFEPSNSDKLTVISETPGPPVLRASFLGCGVWAARF